MLHLTQRFDTHFQYYSYGSRGSSLQTALRRDHKPQLLLPRVRVLQRSAQGVERLRRRIGF